MKNALWILMLIAAVSSWNCPPSLYLELVISTQYNKIASCITSTVTVESLLKRCANAVSKCLDIQVTKILSHEEISGGWKYTNRGYIALDHREKRIVLVFSGSRTWTDWFTNISIQLIPFKPINGKAPKNAKVHKGFYNSYKSLYPDFAPDIKSLAKIYKDYEIWLGGHSLGGAIALLAGIDLRLMSFQAKIITAGSPKVGNRHFNQFFDDIFFTQANLASIQKGTFETGAIRLVHKGDIVPKLPKKSNVFYGHCGIEIFINKDEFPHTIDTLELNNEIQENLAIVKDSSDNLKGVYVDPADLDFEDVTIDSAGSKRVKHASYFCQVTGCSARK